MKLKHQEQEPSQEREREPLHKPNVCFEVLAILGELAEVALPDFILSLVACWHVHTQVRADEDKRGEVRWIDVLVGYPITQRGVLLGFALMVDSCGIT